VLIKTILLLIILLSSPCYAVEHITKVKAVELMEEYFDSYGKPMTPMIVIGANYAIYPRQEVVEFLSRMEYPGHAVKINGRTQGICSIKAEFYSTVLHYEFPWIPVLQVSGLVKHGNGAHRFCVVLTDGEPILINGNISAYKKFYDGVM